MPFLLISLSLLRILRVLCPRLHAPSRCQHPHRESEFTPGQQRGEAEHKGGGRPGEVQDEIREMREETKVFSCHYNSYQLVGSSSSSKGSWGQEEGWLSGGDLN